MKQRMLWLDLDGAGKRLRQVLVTGRAFLTLCLCSMLFFVMLGVSAMAHQQGTASPVHSMKGFAAAVSSGFFGDMLEVEMPAFHSSAEIESFNAKQLSAMLVRMLTDINPTDPTSLLAGELPGLSVGDAFLLHSGIGTDTAAGPEDNTPIHSDAGGDVEEPPAATPDSEPSAPPQTDEPISTEEPDGDADKPATGGSKVVFIYHSHNRESYYPVLTDKSKDPNSKTQNITLVGKRLAKQLEQKGVGSQHSDVDYPTAIPDYRWELSYKYSKKTVKEAMASNKELTYFFDLHRDSQTRKYTTVDIKGESYAQVYFIIGHKNPNWEKNEAFASKIHKELERKYPGISRGIWGKTAASGNAEYNQSLAANSVLIEIGGVENTLEESYRTADALAEVIAGIYLDSVQSS